MPENSGIERLIRPCLSDFIGYSARKSFEQQQESLGAVSESVVRLDANENPYGCSLRVNRALSSCSEINIYADAQQKELSRLLEGYTGVPATQIVSGNGSCELIDLLFRLFVEPSDEVLVTAPSFIMYNFSARICGSSMVEVPRRDDFSIDVNAIKRAISSRTKMIIIDNPNNPTGTLTNQRDIIEIVSTGLPVLVDEAYYEFGGKTVAPLMEKYGNLMVLRTFSKWAGLAGLRIGYGLFPQAIADYLMKIKLPYNVNVAAIIAVRESLKDMDYLMSNVRAIVAERDRLLKKLKNLHFLKPYPSWANFVLCLVKNASAAEVYDRLQRKGIQVRYFNTPLLDNYIRVSVGRPEHTDMLIEALHKIEEEIIG